jgi:hypothetical protein
MFTLFKRSVSAEDLVSVMWDGTRDWPAKHGGDLIPDLDGSFDRSTEEVLDEMVYFLAFATDYAFWCQLEKTPKIQNLVRDRFAEHLEHFAREHRCSPVPAGDWLGDGLIWMPGDRKQGGEPLANLKARFELYGKSLSRRHDRSAGERAAHILAALCGTLDIAFLVYVTPLFLGRWKAVQDGLKTYKIRG